MPNTSTNTNCLNCGTAFVQEHGAPINDVHCYRCGQAKKEGRLSIIRLLKDGISSIFNLDGRLAHTLKDLFFTSKMTRAYIAGKRKFYVNPARLFIFSLILLVSLIVLIVWRLIFSKVCKVLTLIHLELARLAYSPTISMWINMESLRTTLLIYLFLILSRSIR